MKTSEINFRKLEEENAHFLSSLPKKEQEDILDVHRYISNYQMEPIGCFCKRNCRQLRKTTTSMAAVWGLRLYFAKKHAR